MHFHFISRVYYNINCLDVKNICVYTFLCTICSRSRSWLIQTTSTIISNIMIIITNADDDDAHARTMQWHMAIIPVVHYSQFFVLDERMDIHEQLVIAVNLNTIFL